MKIKNLTTPVKILLVIIIFFAIFGSIRIYFIFNPYFPEPTSFGTGEPIIEKIEQACHPIDLLCFLIPLRITAPTDATVGGQYSIIYDMLSETGDYEEWYNNYILQNVVPISDCKFKVTLTAPSGSSQTLQANFEYSSAVVYYARTIWSCSQVGTYSFSWDVSCMIPYYVGNQKYTQSRIVDSGSGNFPVTTDKPICGDGLCKGSPYECAKNEVCESVCESDCGIKPINFCGDGICTAGENFGNCPNDCRTCGNGVCNVGETTSNCPNDCISIPTCQLTEASCNDGKPCTIDSVNYDSCTCFHQSVTDGLSVNGCSGIEGCSRYLCRQGNCVFEPIVGCIETYCGDGLCQLDENSIICPQDCPDPCLNVICPNECSVDLKYLRTEGICELVEGIPTCNYLSSTPCLMGCNTSTLTCNEIGCTIDEECDDNNQCTTDLCINTNCVHTAITNCGIFACEAGEVNLFGYCINSLFLTLIIILLVIIISSSIAITIILNKRRKR